jgi:uncharacterized membrane protein SpoIIM required for sporulation
MQEAVFVRQNIEKWKKVEVMIGDTVFATPDEKVEAYNEVTSDLAFARTQYPGSPLTSYLNGLALNLHRDLFYHKKTSWSRFLHFWTHDIPLAVYDARKGLLLSLAVFVSFIVIGVLSTIGDPDFPRIILGDSYIDMTLRNIEAGQPMAVYATGTQMDSFLSITLNNIMVSFITYAMGVLTSFGTCYYLMHNGIMVGAFISFFLVRGIFAESLLAIMLHGTLELSSIVICGGAGITLGNGWLFPGTYTRMRSFLVAARRSVKVLVSAVPVVVVAAFIEGFFTRFTEIGDGLRLLVILLSLAFILFYYVYLPVKRHRDESRVG